MLNFGGKTEEIQIFLLNLYMSLVQSIQEYASYPIPHHVMNWLLRSYQQPNDKIQYLIKDGTLEKVKKGLYIAGPKITNCKPDPFLLANHILGPSYVSLESALSYHELIPERVYEVTSVTTKAARSFNVPMGRFSYARLPLPYYSYGIRSVGPQDRRFLIASPEKALLDKIITTTGVEFRSRISAMTWLENYMRIDISALDMLDLDKMETWAKGSPKEDSLLQMIKTLRRS